MLTVLALSSENRQSMDSVRTLVSWVLLAIALAEDSGVVQDRSGLIGHSVKLSCNLSRSQPPDVLWNDLARSSSPEEPVLIFQSADNPAFAINSHHPNKGNFIIDRNNFELRISNLTDEDVGEYVCVSRVGNATHKKSYYLSVHEQLKCSGRTQLKQGQHTNLTCGLKYTGNQPSMKWLHGKHVVDSIDRSDLTDSGLVAAKEVQLQATHALDGEIYSCRLEFGDKSEDCPLKFNISYPVRDIGFGAMRGEYYVGEEVSCSARGNPAPEVSLRPASVEGLRDDRVKSHIIIPKTWEGTEVTMECTASNTYEGQLRTVQKSITFQVLAATTVTTTTTTPKPTEPGKPIVDGGNSASGEQRSTWITFPVVLVLLTLRDLLFLRC